jgi:flavin reductase (DIM6/NTAB) family NADH-FMN oxidoreductase RutF
MTKKVIGPVLALQPVPVALVSSVGNDGKANVATFAWVGVVCSEPPMISVAVRPARCTYDLITETGEFVVNIPTADMVQTCNYVGSRTGKKEDKFSTTALTAVPATKVKAPLVAECPVNMECVVRHTLELGTHTLFIGEIVATHVDESVLDEHGRMVMSKVNPLAYSPSADYWAIGERISGR